MENSQNNMRRKILLAMYESVERMNFHWIKGNNSGVIAEKFYQVNLRKDFLSFNSKEKNI